MAHLFSTTSIIIVDFCFWLVTEYLLRIYVDEMITIIYWCGNKVATIYGIENVINYTCWNGERRRKEMQNALVINNIH